MVVPPNRKLRALAILRRFDWLGFAFRCLLLFIAYNAGWITGATWVAQQVNKAH